MFALVFVVIFTRLLTLIAIKFDRVWFVLVTYWLNRMVQKCLLWRGFSMFGDNFTLLKIADNRIFFFLFGSSHSIR